MDGEGDGVGDEGAREVVAEGGGPGGGATAPLDATLDANTDALLARDTTVPVTASVPSASTSPVAAEPPAVALENAVESTGPVASVPATASVPSASTGPVAAEPAAVALESAAADTQDAALEARRAALRSPAFAQLAAATVVSVGGTAWTLASGAWAAMLSDVDDAVEPVTINEVAGDGPRQRCVLILAVGSAASAPAAAVEVCSSARNYEVVVNGEYAGSVSGTRAASSSSASPLPDADPAHPLFEAIFQLPASSAGREQRIEVKLGGLPRDASAIVVRRLRLVPASPTAAAAPKPPVAMGALDLAAVQGIVQATGRALPAGAQTLLDQLTRQAAAPAPSPAASAMPLAMLMAAMGRGRGPAPAPSASGPSPVAPPQVAPLPSPPTASRPQSAGDLVPPMFRASADALERHLLDQMQQRLDALQAHFDRRLDRLEQLLQHPVQP